LLITFAFLLPLLESVNFDLRHGLLPLPYGTAYPDQVYPAPAQHIGHAGGMVTGSLVAVKRTEINIYWDSITPMVAIALGWAYLADRKKAD